MATIDAAGNFGQPCQSISLIHIAGHTVLDPTLHESLCIDFTSLITCRVEEDVVIVEAELFLAFIVPWLQHRDRAA
jgi:exosome complex RNA-binding protein Rrp42 (RNase PH superfamily)